MKRDRREYMREYYQRNRERILAYKFEYRMACRDACYRRLNEEIEKREIKNDFHLKNNLSLI